MKKKTSKRKKFARKPIKKALPVDLLEKPAYRLALMAGAALAAYSLGIGLRLLELPAWNQGHFQVDGQRLLETNDVYYYIAAAQGTSFETAYLEFVKLTRWMQTFTGIVYTTLAFWFPVFLAPLIVLPLALLAWRENLEEAILLAGVIAAGTGTFLIRTRLGCYDHDMISLFLPVCYAGGWLVLLARYAHKGWRFWKPLPLQTVPIRQELSYFVWCILMGGIG